jgi:YD repeat-containing protein
MSVRSDGRPGAARVAVLAGLVGILALLVGIAAVPGRQAGWQSRGSAGELPARAVGPAGARPAVTSWTFDALGRITSVRTVDGATSRYRYQASGQPIAALAR